VQVVECHIRKRYSDTPRLVVTVEPIQPRHESISV
jgi:Holliday junction resolvase RusA-like endonuclease